MNTSDNNTSNAANSTANPLMPEQQGENDVSDSATSQNDVEQNKAEHIKPKDSVAIGLLKQLWRTFKFYTRLLIYIPIVLLVVTALVLGTSFGSKIGIIVASQLIPNLTLDYQSGTINSDLKLRYASWSMDGMSVEIEGLTLDWLPRCFINKQLCVNNLEASTVKVNIQTDLFSNAATVNENASADDASLDEHALLQLPFDISLNHAELTNVNIIVNDMHYNAARLKAQAIWNETGLKVEHLSSVGLEVIIPQSDEINDVQVVTDANKQWPLAQLPAVYLPFRLFVKQLTSVDSMLQLGDRKDVFEHINLSGNYIGYNVSISQLLVNHTYGNINLIGDIHLVDHYPMNIKVKAQIDHITEIPHLHDQTLNLEMTDNLSNLGIELKVTGNTQVNLQGVIDLTRPTVPFDVKLTDSKLIWPLENELYIADIKNLNAKGSIDTIKGQLSGSFISPYQPELSLDSTFAYQQQTLTFNNLDIASEAGNFNIAGDINLADNISWQVNVSMQDLRLQQIQWLNQHLPMRSKISGQFTTHGNIANKKWNIGIDDASLQGRMNGYPLTLEGQVIVDQDFAVNANNLHATALGADLFVNGQVDDMWDIDLELNVPDLSQWLAGARGNLHAKVDVTGENSHPNVDLSAEMQNTSYMGAKLDNLSLKAHYLPFDKHEYSLLLSSQNIYYKGYKLTSLQLDSKGDESQQISSINASGDTSIKSELISQTDLIKQTISAQLNQLNIDNILGSWQLDAPLSVAWDQLKNRGYIEAFCISHPNNKFCLTNNVTLGPTGQAEINFSGNPGQLFAPIMSKNIDWNGNAALTSQVNWQPKHKPTASVNFTLLPGNIKLIRNTNNVVNIDYQQLLFTANLDEKQLRTAISADSEGIASLQAEINVNVTPDKSLNGFIHINSLNLEPFGEFFPRIQTLQGDLSSRISLAGSLDTPELTGNIKLAEAAFALSSNPTLLEKIYLGLQLNGQQATLDGQLHIGDGQALVNGSLYWPNGQVSGDISFKGDNLAVIQPPIAILNVSPNLNIQFDMQQVAVKGSLDIPSGQIKIMQLSEGGVAVSNDVIFNDSISELEVKTSPYAILADVNINVGNELSIDGMGLTGKLAGSLRLQQQAFKPPLLFGDIRVTNGNYKFMGQTLKINAGEVQFVGPIEVPNLNIEAIKEIKEEDLTAGVRVTGTPMRPTVTVFSNPAKEQAEVLSYILTGKGFSSTNDQQSNSLMMGAALSLGSQMDGGAINNIGSTARGVIEKFGFSNVQLDANDDGRMAISGFIGKDLMIKYGIGVFNPGYEMTVRYYLLSQLYLETVSGTISQSLDIYYNYDFD